MRCPKERIPATSEFLKSIALRMHTRRTFKGRISRNSAPRQTTWSGPENLSTPSRFHSLRRRRRSALDRNTKQEVLQMELKRNGSQASAGGPVEYFTGMVRVDPLFTGPGPSRTSGAYVTFEPCSRSNWH